MKVLHLISKKSAVGFTNHARYLFLRQQVKGLHNQSLWNQLLFIEHCIHAFPLEMVFHYAEAPFNRVELRWVADIDDSLDPDQL